MYRCTSNINKHNESKRKEDKKMEDKILYTVTETAELLRISVNDCYKLVNSKRIGYIQLGSKKIPKTEILKFIEQNTIRGDD